MARSSRSSARRAPRRGRRTVSAARMLSGIDRTVVITGKIAGTVVNNTAGVQTSLLNPNNFGPRLASLAGAFQEFRFKRFVIKLHAIGTSASSNVILSYFKTVPATAPVSGYDSYSATESRLIAAADTVPQVLDITSSSLKNNVRPWYNCKTSGDEVIDYAQGQLAYVFTTPNTPTTAVIFEYSYTVEFRGPTYPAASVQDLTSCHGVCPSTPAHPGVIPPARLACAHY